MRLGRRRIARSILRTRPLNPLSSLVPSLGSRANDAAVTILSTPTTMITPGVWMLFGFAQRTTGSVTGNSQQRCPPMLRELDDIAMPAARYTQVAASTVAQSSHLPGLTKTGGGRFHSGSRPFSISDLWGCNPSDRSVDAKNNHVVHGSHIEVFHGRKVAHFLCSVARTGQEIG